MRGLPVSVKGRFFKRVGRTNQRMSHDEIIRRLLASTGSSWDAELVAGTSFADLDQKQSPKSSPSQDIIIYDNILWGQLMPERPFHWTIWIICFFGRSKNEQRLNISHCPETEAHIILYDNNWGNFWKFLVKCSLIFIIVSKAIKEDR